jgi:hemoglobin/transferrin/lactoferrin receptor protein
MKLLKLSTCIILGMGPLAAGAQSTADPVFLGTILVSDPLDPAAEDGVSVTTEAIALSNPADLSELFVAEPTLAVGSSIPMSQKLYVQGIEENNLAISIDGARQNNLIFHHATTTLIDPTLLEAVRIDPGVAPADAGPGALAGALNYQTRDVEDLLLPGDDFGGFYTFDYDTNGSVLSNSLALYGRQNGFEALAFGRYAVGGERTDGAGNVINGTETDLISGLASLAYESDTGHRFEFSLEQVADDASRPYRANIDTVTVGRPVPESRNYDLSRTNVNFIYTDENTTAFWDPTLRLSYSVTELINDERDGPASQYTEGRTGSFNGEISNVFTLATGELNVGVDFYSDEAEYHYYAIPAGPYDSDISEALRNVGLFGQLRIEPLDGLRLSMGARADFQEFTGVTGYTQDTRGLSGNISAEYDVTDRLTIGAGYSHIWGGIELAENYIMNANWDYTTAPIEDVTADNFYFAASYDAGSFEIDGKIFGTDIDNARAAQWTNGPALTTDLSSRGFEIGVATSWDSGFFRAGYAHVDTELNGAPADSYTGNYLTMPLGSILSFQSAHEFANGLLVGGDGQVAFDYDDTPDGTTIEGYTLFNVFAEYSPSSMEHLTLRGEVTNLFDEYYSSRATYGQDFAGQVIPLAEPGRALRLSANFTF